MTSALAFCNQHSRLRYTAEVSSKTALCPCCGNVGNVALINDLSKPNQPGYCANCFPFAREYAVDATGQGRGRAIGAGTFLLVTESFTHIWTTQYRAEAFPMIEPEHFVEMIKGAGLQKRVLRDLTAMELPTPFVFVGFSKSRPSAEKMVLNIDPNYFYSSNAPFMDAIENALHDRFSLKKIRSVLRGANDVGARAEEVLTLAKNFNSDSTEIEALRHKLGNDIVHETTLLGLSEKFWLRNII